MFRMRCCLLSLSLVIGQVSLFLGQACSDLPTILNGDISYSGGTRRSRPVGTVATYSCSFGYTLVGDSSRICQSNGRFTSWSNSAPTCQNCPFINPPPNGVIVFSSGSTSVRPIGTTATYSCSPGYVLTGDSTRTCTSVRSGGSWSGSDSRCTASCSNLTLQNGIVIIAPLGFPILAGAIATHSCRIGYLLFGGMNRTCMARMTGGGVWGGDATMCRAICDDLPNITNAVITYSPFTSPRLMDSVATHTCQLDLPLVGNAQRTCQADRSWRVFFQLGGISVVTRNSELPISEVGVGDGGLVCRTDHPQCCDNSTDAVWLSPDNTIISLVSGVGEFYVTRGNGYITLNRYTCSNTPTGVGVYCCRVPVRGGSTEMLCAVLTLPATSGTIGIDGRTVALAVTLPLAVTVIVVMVTILCIITKQLKDARAQFKRLLESQAIQVHETPSYEDVSKMNVGGCGDSDHSYTPAMNLNQCPAYNTSESIGRGRR